MQTTELEHPGELRAIGKDPDALLARVRLSGQVTDAGWDAARNGGALRVSGEATS